MLPHILTGHKMKLYEFFNLRGQLDKKTDTVLGVAGFVALLSVWIIITHFNMVPPKILPSPFKVLMVLGELHTKDALVRNTFYSVSLNFLGYLEAIILSLLIGFPMALFPCVRSLFCRYINAFRFIPIPATTGIFIAWFGIYSPMKVHFLAFGIMVYLIPTIIQRIEEVDKIYDQTALTLGSSMWQRIFHVFIPGALSKLSDDIRVLTAISWTYIIVVEMINAQGGIGVLSWLANRQVRVEKVFAILAVIMLIGVIQDRIFQRLDKMFFKHKYL